MTSCDIDGDDCYNLNMNDGTAIHLASPEHAEGISRLICDTLRRINAKDYPAKEIDRLVNGFSTARVLEFLEKRFTLVALDDGLVIGTGALQEAEIKSVFVLPELHRKGVGTALVKELERIARGRDKRTLTVSSSLTAIGFYYSLGYREEARKFYGDEETVLMTKAIWQPDPS
ncbi:MAG: GNAT family N-acetyltransferase [Kiloniellales bacterium]